MKRFLSLLCLVSLIGISIQFTHTFEVSALSNSKDYSEKQSVINADNNEEFKTILFLKDPSDKKIKDFARKYKGKIIEFDVTVLDVMRHGNNKTRFDYLLGSNDDEGIMGPYFKA